MLMIIAMPFHVKVEAVVVESAVAEVVTLIVGSMLAALGVNILSNNSDVISDFLNSCCDDVKNFVYDAVDTWKVGVKQLLSIDVDIWDEFRVDAHKYFKNFLSPSIPLCNVVENVSGIYGFTEDESTQLKFHVPTISAYGGRAALFSDNYTITYYYNYDAFSLYDFHLLGNFSWYDYQYFTGFTMYFKSNDLTLVLGSQHLNMYSSDKDAFDVICKPYQFFLNGSVYNFLTSIVIGTVNGNYFKLQSTDAGYAVMDLVTNNLVSLDCKGQSKTYFASQHSFYEWLFESVGLAHQNSAKLFDVAVPSTDTTFNNDDTLTSDVVIDKDYFPTDDDIITETKEAVTLSIPATIEDINYETVTKTDDDDNYPDKYPFPDVSASIWDKFPFCLPSDLYNLFSIFQSDNSEAPVFQFTFPWFYCETEFTIDFSSSDSYYDDVSVFIGLGAFNPLVKLLRFFISLFFVLGLIIYTRKLIGAE